MTRVKICGIREESHALAAAEAGADFIGMVFAPSPRQITPDRAKEISGAVKKDYPDIPLVGVFVNLPYNEVNMIAGNCKLDWIQLSGDEDTDYCIQLEKPFIKTIRIPLGGLRGSDIEKSMEMPDNLSPEKYLFLADTSHGNKYGGTGVTFDWNAAVPIVKRHSTIIAGGLNSENVAELIKTVSPWGVDVSSGVETGGVKDISKIRAFIKTVRRADEIKSQTTA